MHSKKLPVGIVGFCAALGLASACLQSGSIKLPQQLPRRIFTNIGAQSLTMEMSLPGGAKSVPLAAAPGNPHRAVRDQAEAIIGHFEAEAAGSPTRTERADYSVALVLAGRYEDAIRILNEFERDFPGDYATASNLGTAYELKGDVRNALAWIQKGMSRNRASHSGTEWLHVAILETKLNLQKDPRWLVTHSVLDGHESRSLAEKEKALEYQLNERLNFIRGNDPIMYDLFTQAARLTENLAKREYYLSQLSRFEGRAK